MSINQDLAYIRKILRDADNLLSDDYFYAHGEKEVLGELVKKAFQGALTLCDKYSLTIPAEHTRETLAAVDDFARTGEDPESGVSYLHWSWKLHSHLDVIENLHSEDVKGQIPSTLNLVVQMIGQAEYAMEGFNKYPKGEKEFDQFIENMLKPVYPDLDTNPVLTKPIKNFEPDTGIPSLRLLIEYKYVASKADVKHVADEILADTAGYKSKHWAYYFFVIYEQRRLKSEVEWNELLRQCGTAENTWAFVIRGIVPGSKLPT
jgi:hypothetical protein